MLHAQRATLKSWEWTWGQGCQTSIVMDNCDLIVVYTTINDLVSHGSKRSHSIVMLQCLAA